MDKLTPASVLTQGYPQPLRPSVSKSTTAIPVVAEHKPVLPGNLRVAVLPGRGSTMPPAAWSIPRRFLLSTWAADRPGVFVLPDQKPSRAGAGGTIPNSPQ